MAASLDHSVTCILIRDFHLGLKSLPPLHRPPPTALGSAPRVGQHSLLQIFPTQGLKPGPPALQADSSPSEPPGKLEM